MLTKSSVTIWQGMVQKMNVKLKTHVKDQIQAPTLCRTDNWMIIVSDCLKLYQITILQKEGCIQNQYLRKQIGRESGSKKYLNISIYTDENKKKENKLNISNRIVLKHTRHAMLSRFFSPPDILSLVFWLPISTSAHFWRPSWKGYIIYFLVKFGR